MFNPQVGTFQAAIVAQALKTPFYVAAESYKFARLFPLQQRDVVESIGHKTTSASIQEVQCDTDGKAAMTQGEDAMVRCFEVQNDQVFVM